MDENNPKPVSSLERFVMLEREREEGNAPHHCRNLNLPSLESLTEEELANKIYSGALEVVEHLTEQGNPYKFTIERNEDFTYTVRRTAVIRTEYSFYYEIIFLSKHKTKDEAQKALFELMNGDSNV